MDQQEAEAIRQQVLELQLEHRDLDDVIARLSESPAINELQLRRMKKRKLMLKDAIEKLKSKLIPDLNA
jgi:hypothetical protein